MCCVSFTNIYVSKQISSVLKEEIKMFSNLQEIMDIYEQYFTNSFDTNLYLFWLQNNLILYLNDNIPIIHGISHKLLQYFPKLKVDFFLKKINDKSIYKTRILNCGLC